MTKIEAEKFIEENGHNFRDNKGQFQKVKVIPALEKDIIKFIATIREKQTFNIDVTKFSSNNDYALYAFNSEAYSF